MTIRAQKGGEIAPNGEFYKGGQFINTIAHNPKSPTIAKAAKPRKKEIAPYEWALVDSSKKVIYTVLVNCCKMIKTTSGWNADKSTVNHGYLEFAGISFEKFEMLANKFNNGERYID